MKAEVGYSVDYYKAEIGGGSYIKEFAAIKEAAQYLSEKYNSTVEEMTKNIINDANADAVYFDNGHTLLFELSN